MVEKYGKPGAPKMEEGNLQPDKWEMELFLLVDSALRWKRPLLASGAILLAAAGLAVASLNGQDQSAAKNNQDPENNEKSKPTFLQRLLQTPGLNGLERSFEDQMRLEGFGVYYIPVLGKRTRLASAGKVGNYVRPVPFADEERFEPISALDWGDCFRWEAPEVVILNERDHSVDLFAVLPDGFVRINQTHDGGTDWFIFRDDPRCKILPDGAMVYDNGVIGPNKIDQDLVNKPK